MQRPSLPLALVLIAVLAAAILGLARIGDTPQARLDLSLPWGPREFHTLNAQRFADAVARATEGRVRIVAHPSATLGIKGPDSLRAARDGIVPLVEMAGFQQTGQEPVLGLEALPFLVRTQAELRLLHRDLRPVLEEAFARNGLTLLYAVPWPPQNLYASRRIGSLEDMAGLTVRTLDANTTELAQRLGMTARQLPSPDVVPALAAGALDAVMTSTTTGAAQGYWEFLDTIHRTNHGWITNYMVINTGALEQLTESDRNALLDAARGLEDEFWAVSRRDDREKLDLLRARGMTAVTPDAALLTDMQRAARPMWADFARRVPGSRAILDAYLERTGRSPLEPAS